MTQNSPPVCVEVLQTALNLVSGERDRQHGSKEKNFRNIQDLWNAYLQCRRDPAAPLSTSDVALMMCLLKIARTQHGGFNMDDFIDLAGYGAIAGELAQPSSTVVSPGKPANWGNSGEPSEPPSDQEDKPRNTIVVPRVPRFPGGKPINPSFVSGEISGGRPVMPPVTEEPFDNPRDSDMVPTDETVGMQAGESYGGTDD